MKIGLLYALLSSFTARHQYGLVGLAACPSGVVVNSVLQAWKTPHLID